ncbi:MAG: two-component system, LuxR family, sensor kinase FixL [Verrucomicrobiota bacterium]|jgi:signal transduction histidine kinase
MLCSVLSREGFLPLMQTPVQAATLPAVSPKIEALPWRTPLFGHSRIALIAACSALAILLGYLDYWTGYEQSLLLFYLVPIALATWFGDIMFGLVFSVISVGIWVASDLFAGIPTVGFWNLGMALAAYAVFAVLLAKLRTLLGELEHRVNERTRDLRREIAERERLDREIGQVADRERRRLGQELHDTLCQHLTGTALTAQTLREKLATRAAPEIPEADKVVRYIEEGIDLSRNLARGFFSPELEAEGLPFALEGLADNTSERFQIPCSFDTEGIVRVPDATVATQLYRIAQEAVMNAIKHAEAQSIGIRLLGSDDTLTLTITDDGVGLPEKLPQPEGLGFRLMSHGAALLGADFQARKNPGGGTSVVCKVIVPTEPE